MTETSEKYVGLFTGFPFGAPPKVQQGFFLFELKSLVSHAVHTKCKSLSFFPEADNDCQVWVCSLQVERSERTGRTAYATAPFSWCAGSDHAAHQEAKAHCLGASGLLLLFGMLYVIKKYQNKHVDGRKGTPEATNLV